MANRVIYLDIDDEITSAAARIREVETTRVAVVLPYGSRVATSRINFRLLSRDALTHDKWLSVVAGDSATRALAASAGLPVFSSVAEYEASLEPRADAPSGPTLASATAVSAAALGAAGAGAVGAGAAAVAATPVAPLAASATGATVRTDLPRPVSRPSEPTPQPDLGGSGRGPRATDTTRTGGGASRIPILIGLGILGLAVLIAGVGAYLLLPSATIAVTPRTERIGPIHLTVTADTAATEPDQATLVVPAQTLSVDVAANDTFQAGGRKIEETTASGVVRFDNLDFLNSNTVPAGSIVGTDRGVRFRTNATVTVPKADIVGLSLFPGRVSVKVTAVKAGEDGNVDPNTITVVPAGEDPIALKVTNPNATSGGTHTEIPRVTQQDVKTAMATLTDRLDADFRTKIADPALAPDGATVFPETAVLGPATPTVDTTKLVGQEIDSFELGLSATGTAIAVDPEPVAALAEKQLRDSLDTKHQLVADSVDVEVGNAIVDGQSVSFPVSATAEQIAILDPVALKAQVLGKTPEQVQAALAPYGTVKVTLWPDWASSVPSFENRVEVTIDHAVPVEQAPPSPPPSGTP